MKYALFQLCWFLALLVLMPLVKADVQNAAPPAGISTSAASSALPVPTTNTKELNVLLIGHSLTHGLRNLDLLAPMIGHAGYKSMLYTILGAGIKIHYEAEWKPWRQLFFPPDKKWDVLIMSARDADRDPKATSTDEIFAPKFAAEAFKNNPQCQVYIYGNWPEVYEDFTKPAFAYTPEYIERVGAAVDKAFPNAPKTRIIPCCLLMRELEQMADRGELPGVASRFDLFCDAIHPSTVGWYAVNMLVMVTVYNESPVNYPAEFRALDAKGQPNQRTGLGVPEATATVIKNVAWDILQTYPPAGLTPRLVVANRQLEPAIAGQPYKAELKALNAAGPCVWSITKGALPPGLAISDNGTISGQSDVVGSHPITLHLADGRSTCERQLVLSINNDIPPRIPDQSLETVTLDQYVTKSLKMEGGVGHITWSVGGGKLPYGIKLSSGGMLIGSPGEAGEFDFTIKVEDSFPTGSRSAEKAFKWTIGPASPDTLMAKYLESTWAPNDPRSYGRLLTACTLDGKLDEPFWKLDQPIAKKVKGTPTKKASFGAVWNRYKDHGGGMIGMNLFMGFKVLDGPIGRTPKDGIHIYLDGNHNRSLVYSSDDTHIFIPRTHKGGQLRVVIGKDAANSAFVQEIEGGYTVEIVLQGGGFFTGEGNWLKFGAKGVYGLDVAVDEGDDKAVSQQVWRGDANDAEDTSHFGTIVLTDQPAIEGEQPKAP